MSRRCDSDGRIELQNIKSRFPVADLTGEYTYGGARGYIRVAGVLRRISWDDVLTDQFELSDSATGSGVNFSSNVKAGTDSTATASRFSSRSNTTSRTRREAKGGRPPGVPRRSK
jgi:hypothetical protein